MTQTTSQVEAAAKLIYETWKDIPEYRLWQNGGNSLKQDEARRIARQVIELASQQEVAAPVGDAKRDEVMRHDYPILQQFHTKHAMGPLAAPSCLCCGKSTQGTEIGVQHLELPGIVICAPCKAAASRVPVASPADSAYREAVEQGVTSMKTEQLFDREGITLESAKPFAFTCCDCGLTHRMVIVSEDGKPVGFAVERIAERATPPVGAGGAGPTDAEPDHQAILGAVFKYIGAHQSMEAAMKHGVNVHGAISEIIGATDNLRAAIEQAAGAVPEGWMRDEKQVRELMSHLVNTGWAQTEDGAECVDQGSAMAAEVIERVLLPMLAASPSPLGREAGSSDHSVPCAGGGVTQWQSIETAPKWTPGTEREFVLLWCPNAYNVEHIKVGYIEAGGTVYSMYEATGEMGSEPQRDATHWMPRLAAPEVK